MERRIAAVEPDQHLVRELVGHFLGDSLDAVVRGQVARRPGLDVGGEEVPVLVAVTVLQVQDEPGMVGPEVAADASALVAGHRCGTLDRLQRRHPHVEHTLKRGQVGDTRPVVTDRYRRALGVAEQRLPGNQPSFTFFHRAPSRSTRAPSEVSV